MKRNARNHQLSECLRIDSININYSPHIFLLLMALQSLSLGGNQPFAFQNPGT
jgi:hypothetical protein